MGLFAHWVCAKEAADALRDAGFAEVVETEAAGWQMGYPERRAQLPEWEEFDDAVARLAADAGGAALGSWIYDSDVGYLIAAEGDRGITRLVVNPDAADAYDLPLPEAWPDGAIAGFAEWSKGAPTLSTPPQSPMSSAAIGHSPRKACRRCTNVSALLLRTRPNRT